jgi:RNA polymerase sigma-70 factor, ECF subfamily
MAPDDAALWARIRAEDGDAFGLLFERYGKVIYAYCFRRTADADRAADLMSITFFEAWRRRNVQLDGGKVLPWLFGVAINVLRTERRNRRRYQAALDRLPAPLDEHDFAQAATDRLDAEQRMREALQVVSRLPGGERDVFVLVAWQGLSPEDAGYALGISAGAVRTRLSRARKRLALQTETESPANSMTRNGVEVP